MTPTSPPILPFFKLTIPLGAWIVFWLHQPTLHFINSCRERGLRAIALKKYVVGKLDFENLVKFTIDTIFSVVFADDRLISQLTCQNVWDEGDDELELLATLVGLQIYQSLSIPKSCHHFGWSMQEIL